MSTQRLMWKWEFPKTNGNSLAVQWLGLDTFTAESVGSIPGRGTKILQAAWHGQKKKKKKKLIQKCSRKHFPKVETTQTSIDDEKINKM